MLLQLKNSSKIRNRFRVVDTFQAEVCIFIVTNQELINVNVILDRGNLQENANKFYAPYYSVELQVNAFQRNQIQYS